MSTRGCAEFLTCLVACVVLLNPRAYANERIATETRCWDAREDYHPPDFSAYFPECATGAEVLSAWWAAPDRDERPAAEVMRMLRQGLRRYDEDRTALLRWMGRRFMDPQDPELIEIMYHAVDSKAHADLRSPAIRFGISAVRPKTPNMLKALAALSIVSENPDELDQIALGIDGQRDEALHVLAMYLESDDATVREKAAVVEQLWALELKAHDWARARKRDQTEATYGHELPSIREILLSGSSAERKQTLDRMLEHEIVLIVPDSALAWFAQCAIDPETEVRAIAARMLGEHWILNASRQDPVAVELVLKLSEDDAHEVRYNAIYYGLSVVSPKNDAVINRLLEVAAQERRGKLIARIRWGLRAYGPQVQRELKSWISSSEKGRSEAGARLHRALAE